MELELFSQTLDFLFSSWINDVHISTGDIGLVMTGWAKMLFIFHSHKHVVLFAPVEVTLYS